MNSHATALPDATASSEPVAEPRLVEIAAPQGAALRPFPIDADERHLHRLLLVMGGVALVLAAATGIIFVNRGQLGMGAYAVTLAFVGVALLLMRRWVTRRTLALGARAASWTLLGLVLLLFVAGNRAPTLAMVALLAALIAVPYVDGRSMRRLAVAAFVLAALVGAGYALNAPPAPAGVIGSEAVFRFFGVIIGSALCLYAVVHVGARLTAGAQRYRDLFQRVPVGMYRSTPDGRFLDANKAFAQMFGFDQPEDLLHVPATELYADPLDRNIFRDAVAGVGVARRVEFRAKRRDGSTFWVRDSALLVTDSVGAPLYYEGILEDATETKHREQKLEHRASIDSLTGLANRAVLMDALDDALRQASPQRPVALLFVDLDDFKQVNDRFGHTAGDLTLTGAARRLSYATRSGDTAARFGGDEFAVLLQPPAGRAVAEMVAHRIAAAFREPFNVAGDEVVVGASIGIAVAQEPMTNARLLERADQAMYRAKNLDKIEIFES